MSEVDIATVVSCSDDIITTNANGNNPVLHNDINMADIAEYKATPNNVDIDIPDVDGNSALHHAVMNSYEDRELIKTLIKAGDDLNRQNVDGNTALHLAIMKKASIDIITMLIENGSNCELINLNGSNPIELIKPDDINTYLNLLKLEQLNSYRDIYGNTLLHEAGMSCYSKGNGLCKCDLNDRKTLEINLNTQNENGQTITHVLASKGKTGEENLKFLLTYFENLDVLTADKNGDTFLHLYIKKAGYYENKFLENLLEGRYNCCPSEIVKALLLKRNNLGLSALHVLSREQSHLMNTNRLLLMFLNAGADVRSSNIYGETVLHALVSHSDKDDTVALIHLSTKNGAFTNAQNAFGESPIFLARRLEDVRTLLDDGADANICNKAGQNILMSNIFKTSRKLTEWFLSEGGDINATDINGNNLLHYAAWYKIDTDVVKLLKNSGVDTIKDNLGQLPCQVAELRGTRELINELCVCEDAAHRTLFAEELIRLDDLKQKNYISNQCLQKRKKYFQETALPEVLATPGLGCVIFEGEAEKLKASVVEIVTHICRKVGEKEKFLKSSVMYQSGSVSENTKIGLPDEFDFICLIDLFPEICEIDESVTGNDSNYAYLKLKKELRGQNYRCLFDQDCYLDPQEVAFRFSTAVMDIVQDPDLYANHPHVIYRPEENTDAFILTSPNCKISLLWIGCKYKTITIDIDLVPACQIKGRWPHGARLDLVSHEQEKLQNDGALLLLSSNVESKEVKTSSKLFISAMTAEKMHMTGLPSVARDAYMMSKIMCDSRISPAIFEAKHTDITSYMLKNCMFHVLHNIAEDDGSYEKACSTKSLDYFVRKIFEKLIQFSADEVIPSYVFPWRNVLKESRRSWDDYFSAARSLHAKMILGFLSVETDLESDIEVVEEMVFI